MRQFYQTFKNCDTLRHELTWSHYRLLLRVKDKGKKYISCVSASLNILYKSRRLL
ncbi:MAG: hypothetical protein IK002_00810 [Treponema sp.]|nr:hypothetical protein [Treponema sp.]